MSMDRYNQWLTLLANVGVIAGIIFLAIELRHNNMLLVEQRSEALACWADDEGGLMQLRVS